MNASAVTRFGDLTDAAAARWGDREALVFRQRRYSFRQIAAEVDRVARGLIRAGVRPGEKVAIWLVNCPEWIFTMFALAKIGAVHVPINTRFRTVDLAQVLERSNTSTLITHDASGPVDYLAMVRELAELDGAGDARRVHGRRLPDLERVIVVSDREHSGAWSWPELLEAARSVDAAAVTVRAAAVRPTDTVFIMYTSGTTGFPRGVMRDHSLLAHLADRYRRLQSSERDVFVNYLPLFHIFGYVDGPLGSMLAGYRQILTDTFDPDEALDLIEREGATHIDGFDTHLKLLVDAQESRPRNLSTLRTGVIAAGAASATPIVYRARKVLAPLRHLTAYGMTEVGSYLNGYPGVSQAAVVSYPDARLGEMVVAFIQVTSGARVAPEGVIAFCRGRIASFKIPRHVFVVDELPMTSSGKVQKARLRDTARERLG